MGNLICGVYTITNCKDRKVYVGESLNVNRRLSQHKSNLKANRHSNLHLQRAVNQIGIENFEFEVLEYCKPEFTKSCENYWCNLLDSHNPERGYNFDSCDPLGICRKKSLETRKLISKLVKERNLNGENNPFYGKNHSIESLNKIKETKILRNSYKNVSMILKGKRRDINIINKSVLTRELNNSYSKFKNPVYQICKVTKEILAEFDSFHSASKTLNIFSGDIGRVCRGVKKSAGGFIWKFKNQK